MTGEEKKVIFASSLGTVFEWYDSLPGRLARGLHQQEFLLRRQSNRRLHLHAARLRGRLRGAAVRRDRVRPPGDLVGRKHTFLVTIVIMGISTFVVGFLPGYASIGIAAP